MASFQRILAATDQSPQASRALAEATRIAVACQAKLTALIVVQTAAPPAESSNIWKSGEDTEEKLRKQISSTVAKLKGAEELQLDVRVKWGVPAPAIVATAADLGCDLIVLGARGAGDSKRLGHVAMEVIASASCPVAVIPAGTPAPEPTEKPVGDAVAVREIMHAPVATITSDDTLDRAKAVMLQGGVHQLPVVDGEALIGIVSRHDIDPHESYLERTKVDAVMTHGPVTVASTDPATRAANLLVEQNVNALPVVDDNHLVGMVSKTDLLRLTIAMLSRSR